MAFETDRQRGAHLLRRFGLGASESELDFYMQDGLSGAIDRLLDFKSVDEGFSIGLANLTPKDGKPLNMRLVVSWWAARMLVSRRPLQEKMTLFWHDHFATSAAKVKAGPLMLKQNETLRANCTGSFRDLLRAVSQDPAMLLWLDSQENVKGHAQENFAREVMELFTLGIGHYTEKDVQEVARAFTGWSFRRGREGGQFLFRRFAHDGDTKTLLGQSGPFNGNDVLNILCDMEQTSRMIVGKILDWFVYPDPEPEVVERFARIYRESNLDTATLLRAIMKSSEFYSAKAERSIVKNPVDFVIATARQVGIGRVVSKQLEGLETVEINKLLGPGAIANSMKGMGMFLFYPPDVAGWEGHESWISSATMVERMGWADRLYGAPAANDLKGVRKISLRFPNTHLVAGATTPEAIVDKILSVYDAPLTKVNRSRLIEVAAKGGPTSELVTKLSRLVFASPEFQFA
ncbi:MAG: DUF1800 domain-containing protein [Fimbriimonas sp.]